MLFGTLPPEVNSGRMYTGPGSGPMLAAATAWEALTAELGSAASAYRATIATLTEGAWRGSTALLMAAAAAPYAAWMSATSAQAGQTAAQARAVAGAYEVAHAATVPPWLVASNRTLLMALVASNILGQNTAAIAAAEAHYAEMWAQDAAAMYGYAAAAGATRLTPFSEPPRVADEGAVTGQAGAVAHAAGASAGRATQSALTQSLTGVSQALQAIAAPAPATPATAGIVVGTLNPEILLGLSGVPWLFAMQNVNLPIAAHSLYGALGKASALGLLNQPPVAGALPDLPPNTLAPTVAASIGRADSVGALSIPRNWTANITQVTTLAAPLPTAGSTAVAALAPEAQNAMYGGATAGTLTGRALGATGATASRAIAKVGKAAAGDEHMPTTTIVVIPEDD